MSTPTPTREPLALERWKPTDPDAVYTGLYTRDQDGNRYYMPAHRELVVVTMANGLTSTFWTETEALAWAEIHRRDEPTPTIAELKQIAAEQWRAACEAEGIDPASPFVVLGNTEEAQLYNETMLQLARLRR